MPISYLRIHQCNDACKVPNIELCTEQTLLLAVLCWATATSNVSRVIYVIRYFCSSQQTFITMCVFDRSVVSASAMLWTVAHQATLFKGFPRQKFWEILGCHFLFQFITILIVIWEAVQYREAKWRSRKKNMSLGIKHLALNTGSCHQLPGFNLRYAASLQVKSLIFKKGEGG